MVVMHLDDAWDNVSIGYVRCRTVLVKAGDAGIAHLIRGSVPPVSRNFLQAHNC